MSFIDEVVITPAGPEDLEIVLDTIIEAEKSGSEIISSCLIFEMSEQEYRELITTILLENHEDYEFSLSGFLVAKYKDENIGALGSWIESKGGIDSSIIKANALFTTMDRDKLIAVQPNLKTLRGTSFSRTPGALQLEYAYVKPEYRRKGVFTKLIRGQIARYLKTESALNAAEAVLFKENYKSYTCYGKLNFVEQEGINLKNQPSEKFFPYSERVLLRLNQNGFTPEVKD